jgi:flagellar biosynthesis GTPase FlhF
VPAGLVSARVFSMASMPTVNNRGGGAKVGSEWPVIRAELETSNRAPGRAFTTSEMINYERNTIRAMRAGQSQHEPIVSFETRRDIVQDHSHLSESQRAAVEQILSSRDQVTALEGVAGAGKTTSLVAIREAAEREGYKSALHSD